MQPTEVSEKEEILFSGFEARSVLERYERSKILEIYFSRLDGRVPNEIPSEFSKLYEIELNVIKAFLLGQYPQDTLLQKVFIMKY